MMFQDNELHKHEMSKFFRRGGLNIATNLQINGIHTTAIILVFYIANLCTFYGRLN